MKKSKSYCILPEPDIEMTRTIAPFLYLTDFGYVQAQTKILDKLILKGKLWNYDYMQFPNYSTGFRKIKP